jgi:hypothetical protein
MESLFIDDFAKSSDIRRADIVLPKVTRMRMAQSPATVDVRKRLARRCFSAATGADPSVDSIQTTSSDGSAGRVGEQNIMSNAHIIEIGSHTAGIVARDERSFRFFSSDRIFDSLAVGQRRGDNEATGRVMHQP